MDSITGTLENIRYARNGYLIGTLNSGESVKGGMGEPVLGQTYRLAGEWEDDPKWGRQFVFETYTLETPKDAVGIYRYIVRVAKWVGPTIGQQIIKTFGDETLAILKQDPQRVAEAIIGLSLKRAREISQKLLENEEQEAAMVELDTMLSLGGLRLPKNTITALIEEHRSDAPARVRQNPYGTLMAIRGIGFTIADRVALAIGYEREGMERQVAGCQHALQDAADTKGHTWLPGETFIEKVQELIGLSPSPDVRVKLLEDEAIRIESEMIALSKYADDEQEVAGTIRMLLDHGGGDLARTIDLKGLAPDQQEAFTQCLAHPVFCLTGAPGTGKTYTLRRIISQFAAWNYRISLAAPTGKAAKRMTEMIDRPASTIHRLLGPVPYTWNGELRFSFSFGRGAPLSTDLLVVDEFSMVDISLAASLTRAICARGIRVLIVGDHYQLPSVGPGAVLRDLLAAGVPSYELKEIKRNTGEIVRTCHAIKDGLSIMPSSRLDLDNGINMRHIEESDPSKIQAIIKDLVSRALPARGYNPVWDVQVLSPRNDTTDLSCLDLNSLLQNTLNINPPVPGINLRPGDKVLQRKNKLIGEEFIVNGDLGVIEFINDNEIGVLFHYPDRFVTIKRRGHNLQLAYCITIHKMQGSEAPVIILPVHSSFGMFFNRELVYTAISRAQEICITVGEWSALEAAANRVSTTRRITRLCELIKGGE